MKNRLSLPDSAWKKGRGTSTSKKTVLGLIIPRAGRWELLHSIPLFSRYVVWSPLVEWLLDDTGRSNQFYLMVDADVATNHQTDIAGRLRRLTRHFAHRSLHPSLIQVSVILCSTSCQRLLNHLNLPTFACYRKLYCPRNTLHMHLFISFIMRAFMALLRDNLFVDGLDNLIVSMENLPESNTVDLLEHYQGTSGVSIPICFILRIIPVYCKSGLTMRSSGNASWLRASGSTLSWRIIRGSSWKGSTCTI